MKIKKNGKVVTLTEGDIRRILKRVISEQEEGNTKSSNLTLTDTFKTYDKEPIVLKSNHGFEVISFPPASDGMPVKGNYGVNNGKSIILFIGEKKWLVIGNIGTLDSNNKVVDEKLGALVIQASKDTGDGAGSSVIPRSSISQVSSLPKLTSLLAKSMGGGRTPADWFISNKDMLVKAFKMASVYGVDTSMIDDKNGIAKFETEVKRKLQA